MTAINTKGIHMPTTHTPSHSHDQEHGESRRNLRGHQGKECKLLPLRIQRTKMILSEIESITKKLKHKPGVTARLEHSLARCNEELDRATESAKKFANRKESGRTKAYDTFERGGEDS